MQLIIIDQIHYSNIYQEKCWHQEHQNGWKDSPKSTNY